MMDRMDLLTDAQRRQLSADHPEWTVTPDSMSRTWTFTDFVAAMGFVTRVAILAEKAFHHPDVDIRWNRVTLTLSTHEAGGLTSYDADLAATLDAL
ncbi:MAG: 4a-hydroxytetrahydrobiopterin dehydratase [Acidimicrobiia bacterium]|nr:4a-hydroxytetrahydrobiopterin dehydratase [Acidimicrobiia bacterium]MDH4307903.1 4a-hydroxytetrahydrobiopterin dehydratase [Acidimicrobiia bacterium]MDH5293848.1 4a-hydroxytetrahydrobiopterin dehydratase [Acidimicrobiia bacterium]